jgi:hypothetical protein
MLSFFQISSTFFTVSEGCNTRTNTLAMSFASWASRPEHSPEQEADYVFSLELSFQ